jgi:uncharacterized phage infection (PIP) family protein YhgE
VFSSDDPKEGPLVDCWSVRNITGGDPGLTCRAMFAKLKVAVVVSSARTTLERDQQMARMVGIASSRTIRSLAGQQLRYLVGSGFLCIGISCFVVLPALAFGSEPVSGTSEARLAPVTELTRTLANASNRLEELSKLTKKAAAERSKLDALRAREQIILADIRAIQADRGQLRDARDAAIARTEDLAKALEQATSISQALGNQLASERQGNSESRAREAELAAQLDSLKSARALAGAEIASLRGRLKDGQERLAEATQERVRAETKLRDLEGRSAEEEERITALQAQISALEEEVKAKDGALEGLASLRTESDELRQRLAATEAELKRKEEESDRLSAELVDFRSAAKAATDVAQQHLLTVEGKIRALNDSAKLTQPSDPQTSREPKVRPELGSRAARDLIDARTPPAFSVERVDAPGSSTEKGRTDTYQLIAPVQAAEESSDSSLQIRIRDALLQQREQLQGLMKELDDSREGLR